VSFGYDAAWRVSSIANGIETITRSYDLAGQVRSEQSSRNATTLTYGYDPAGTRDLLQVGSTSLLTYAYDDDGRLDSMTRGSALFDFGYDNAHRRTNLTYPSASGLATAYAYDDRSQLLSLTSTKGAAALAQFGYLYDRVGNRTSKTALDHAESYGYDVLDRLTEVSRSGLSGLWHYGYDKVGNRTSHQSGLDVVQAAVNGRNQVTGTLGAGPLVWRGTLDEPGSVSLTSVQVNGQPAKMLPGNVFEATIPSQLGQNDVTVEATDVRNNVRSNVYRVTVTGSGASYGYDANGNLVSKTEGANAWSYVWDAENRLLRACLNVTPCSDANATARFSYDGLGRRVEKVAGGVTTQWAYDGDDIVKEVKGSTTSYLVHGPGVDEPLADTGSGFGLTGYYLADGLGSIVAKADASGTVTLSRRYDAWGNLELGATTAGYAFTGREWDPETGLYYYRARYYDPKIGRFLSEDPIGFEGGMSFYTYVGGNPARYSDPNGESVIGYFVRAARGTWKWVATRAEAARAIANGTDVKVVGPGHGGDAWKMGKETWGRDAKRHRGHILDGEEGLPHVQHRRGRRGHIFHTAKGFIVFGLGCLIQAPGGDLLVEELAEELFPEPGEPADVVLPENPAA
jgi:RHS repeat-associated protein